MSIDNKEIIDSVAYEFDKLMLYIYDHLEFNCETEKEHMLLLQDKLNMYIWYIDSEQYAEMFSEKEFIEYVITIVFLFEPSQFCKKYIENANRKLLKNNINIQYKVETISD